jgi:hypothetical protein
LVVLLEVKVVAERVGTRANKAAAALVVVKSLLVCIGGSVVGAVLNFCQYDCFVVLVVVFLFFL